MTEEDWRRHGVACLEKVRWLVTENPISVGMTTSMYQVLITTLLIYWADALKVTERFGQRCELQGPDIFPIKEGDLHALIAHARNVACHPDSMLRMMPLEANAGATSLSWGVIWGNASVTVGDEVISNPFDDDALIVFGGVRLYLIRNLVRADEWVRERLAPQLHSFK